MRQPEPLPKRMAALVLPMAMQNLFSASVSALDAVMLGGLSQSSFWRFLWQVMSCLFISVSGRLDDRRINPVGPVLGKRRS